MFTVFAKRQFEHMTKFLSFLLLLFIIFHKNKKFHISFMS